MYGTVLQHDNADNASSYADRHTAQFLANNNAPNSPLVFHIPRLTPKQAHLERVGETCSRQSERPCKMCVSCFRH